MFVGALAQLLQSFFKLLRLAFAFFWRELRIHDVFVIITHLDCSLVGLLCNGVEDFDF